MIGWISEIVNYSQIVSRSANLQRHHIKASISCQEGI